MFQIERERGYRGGSDSLDLCPSCAPKSLKSLQYPLTMAQSESGLRTQLCSSCGREFLLSSGASFGKRGLFYSQSSEDALESVDSGNSSGHSERSLTDNHIVAVKIESNSQSKQMLHMEVAVLRRLKGKKNFCELLGCGKTQRINYIVMTLQVS